jgi:hypothetical protein
MSNRRDKEKWLRKSANKNKCCGKCSQLFKTSSGDYGCCFLTHPGQKSGAYVLISAKDIFKPHSCYDEYNGKNL